MKRICSLILAVLLAILATSLLVACGGGMTEKQWNDAMDYLKTCDTVTITYEQEKTANARITKTYDTRTLQYDATKGMLYAEQKIKTYNIFDVLLEQTSKYQYVEVVEQELHYYDKTVKDNRDTSWEATKRSFDSEVEVIQQLNQVFLSYLKLYQLDNFNYADFTAKRGKYEKSEIVNDKNAVWKITFSDAKMSNAHYETSHKRGSSDIDYTKISISIQYSVEITAPSDLEHSYWK